MDSASSLPRVILKPRKARPFYHRHPWVFTGAVHSVQGKPSPGDEVALYAHDGEFIARGLFNPHSNLRVRLYSWDEQTVLDDSFWSVRLDRAVELRKQLFPHSGNDAAYRLVFSEADGLSGLIVDRYGSWLILQFTSLAMSARQHLFVELLQKKLQPQGIWLRTEQGIRDSEGLQLSDGLVAGDEPPRPLFVEEHGIRYGVDIVAGQKTGFFLDQRLNRKVVAKYITAGRVLDLFCYSGAFGISAVKLGHADEVLAVDVSESALTLAKANAQLNGVSEKFRFEQAKVFDTLEKLIGAGEQFETVILDPPKMTRHRAGIKQAMRGYFSLNRMAVDLLPPGGLLVTCSCSGLITRKDFEEMLNTVSMRTGRMIQILETRGQSPDHPTSVNCFETEYLKCYICRVT